MSDTDSFQLVEINKVPRSNLILLFDYVKLTQPAQLTAIALLPVKCYLIRIGIFTI